MRRSRNVAGYIDASGRFRPIRDDDDYDPSRLSPESLTKESRKTQRAEGLTTRSKKKSRRKNPGPAAMAGIERMAKFLPSKIGPLESLKLTSIGKGSASVKATGSKGIVKFRVQER